MSSAGILVIGGTGFVGRALIAGLSKKYTNIYVIARHAHDWNEFPNVRGFDSSLENIELLNTLLPHCETVFHLASETTPGASALQPSFEAEANLLPSLRFLEVLQNYPEVRLIYVSSGGAVYGNAECSPVKETVALAPLSYYGAGKAALEKFILAFCQQTRNSAVVLRPSNFYGPGQPYKHDFGVIPTIFHHLWNGTRMSVWGDGEVVRDYLYIEDFVSLCSLLLEKGQEQNKVKIYNVGSGTGSSLNELCALAEKVAGRKISCEYQPSRKVDVKRITLDCSLLDSAYHWSSSTSLREGLTNTWEYFCSKRP